MGTPRSEKGFDKEIKALDEKIAELQDQINEAPANSDEEGELMSQKAGLEIERADLITKFDEFKAANKSKDVEKDKVDPMPQEKQSKEVEAKELEADMIQLPKVGDVVRVSCRMSTDYMVNPHTHDKITNDNDKKIIVDNWTLSQLKAGILILVD